MSSQSRCNKAVRERSDAAVNVDCTAFVTPLPVLLGSGVRSNGMVKNTSFRSERRWRASSAPPSGNSPKRSRSNSNYYNSNQARSGGSTPRGRMETIVRATQDNYATTDDLQLFLRVAPRERRQYQPSSNLFAINGSAGRSGGGGGGGGSRRRANNDALVDCYVVPDGEQVVIHPDLR